MKPKKEQSEQEFKPGAFFNDDGDMFEVYWDNEMYYGATLKGHDGFSSMCLMRKMPEGNLTGEEPPVGVQIYSIRKILEEAGYKLVPLNTQEIIDIFLRDHPDVQHIDWDNDKITVFFKHSSKPFSIEAFEPGSYIRSWLEDLKLLLETAQDRRKRYDRQKNKS